MRILAPRELPEENDVMPFCSFLLLTVLRVGLGSPKTEGANGAPVLQKLLLGIPPEISDQHHLVQAVLSHLDLLIRLFLGLFSGSGGRFGSVSPLKKARIKAVAYPLLTCRGVKRSSRKPWSVKKLYFSISPIEPVPVT